MLPHAVLAGIALVLAAPSPNAGAVGALSWTALRRQPDLVLRLRPAELGAGVLAAEDEGSQGPPPCLGDVCQPRVAVPGMEPSYGRPHRSELFVLALTRAHVEPLATVAWALVATGLRVDWTPVALEGPGAGAHGWGSVFLRLRLRLDADNVPVFPQRPR